MNAVQILPMRIEDYEAVVALWNAAEGVHVRECDSREGVARHLARNPGLSVTAWADGQVVGAVMCGHDGRRGVLYHLAVDPAWRRRGVARRMVERCREGLAGEGIEHCFLFVLTENESGRRFWESMGWEPMNHVVAMWK